jgi:dolichol-phosphate mannosyltransferase
MSETNLSIIIPVFNEQDNIETLLKRLGNLKSLPRKHEIIFIDDGSWDNSANLIEKQSRDNKNIKLIAFTRNFGHQAAVTAGLKYAGGEYVGIMDADLQDPPKVLMEMYKVAKRKGVDIVYAVREKREGSITMTFLYRLFYRLYSYASESPVNVDSGDFSILTRRAVDKINSLPERIRFLRGLRSWTGLSSAAYIYNRPKRYAGKSKYSWEKLFGLAFNGITSTSTKPLRIATILGSILSIASLSLAGVYVFLWLSSDLRQDVPGFVTLAVLILLFSGLQLFTLGILGEYIATIFLEVKKRPSYLIDRKINI